MSQHQPVRVVLVLSCALLASHALAGEVLIDFDDRTGECVFGLAERLGNQWEAEGIVFSGPSPTQTGAITEETCSGFEMINGHSSPNFVGHVPGLTQAPMRMDFTRPAEFVSVLGTNYRRLIMLTLTAYDESDMPIGSVMVETFPLGQLQELRVDGPGIAWAEVTAEGEEDLVFDDVRFALEPVVIPDVLLYESTDPALVVDDPNVVGIGPSPVVLTGGSAPVQYYQADDGTGFPSLIFITWDGTSMEVTW
ncbi:MAG: hypothetical protein AAF533_06390 [Acidobacteriota bacterium]